MYFYVMFYIHLEILCKNYVLASRDFKYFS